MVQFGNYLEDHKYAPWSSKYLPYIQLKERIHAVVDAQQAVDSVTPEKHPSVSAAGLQFFKDKEQAKVHSEIADIRSILDEYRDTINDHYIAVKKQINERKEELQATLAKRKAKANRERQAEEQPSEVRSEQGTHVSKSAAKKIASYKVVSEKLNELFALDTRLVEFATINYMAFYKFLKKFQKQTKLYVLSNYIASVENCFFVTNLLQDADPGSAGGLPIDDDAREDFTHKFASRADSVARLCEEALIILVPSMSSVELQTTHEKFEQAKARYLSTLEVCSSSEFRDVLQRMKLSLFTKVLQTMELQFHHISTEGAEAMRTLQRIQHDLFTSGSDNGHRDAESLRSRSKTILKQFGKRARAAKLSGAENSRSTAGAETDSSKGSQVTDSTTAAITNLNMQVVQEKEDSGSDEPRTDESQTPETPLQSTDSKDKEDDDKDAPARFQWAFEDDAFEQRFVQEYTPQQAMHGSRHISLDLTHRLCLPRVPGSTA